MTNSESPGAGLRHAVLVWAAQAFLLFSGVVVCLDRFGTEILEAIQPIDGESRLAHAEDLREAGYDDEAVEAYRVAIEAQFWGLQNRAFALKQLGALLVRRQAFAEAAPYFEQCLATGRAPISVYKDYLEALISLQRWDAAQGAAAEWLDAATGAKHAVETSRAHHTLGRIALERGDTAAALQHFEAGNAAFPGGGNALALARLAADAQQPEKVKACLEQVFLSGPEAGVMRDALALWAKAVEPGG